MGHSHRRCVLAISDVAMLFEGSHPHSDRKPTHVTYKLLFYAAYVLSTQSTVLHAAAEEAAAQAVNLQGEVSETALLESNVLPPENRELVSAEVLNRRARIEEL
jgi:hypothetical protein